MSRAASICLFVFAVGLFGCGDNSIVDPPSPGFPDPVHYVIQSGVGDGSYLIGWCRVPTPMDSLGAEWRAERFLPGHPYHQWMEITRTHGRDGQSLGWILGPDSAGPFRGGRIAKETTWDALLHGWGDLRLDRGLLPGDHDPVLLALHSPLGPADLGLRWHAAERPDSLELSVILLAEPDETPAAHEAVLHYEGTVNEGGADLESFRLVHGESTVYIKLFTQHFPAPFAVWWEQRGIYLRSWGEVAPDMDDQAFAPDLPVPVGYSIEESPQIYGDLAIGRDLFRPNGEGPFPAALLMVDDALADRNDAAAFGHLAHRLATVGWLVARLDKPGTGASTGNIDALDLGLRRQVMSAAWTAMRAHPDVDPSRCVMIGHGEGAALALEYAAHAQEMAGVLALSPLYYDPMQVPSIPEAEGVEWVTLLGENCYAGKHDDLRMFDTTLYLSQPGWAGKPVAMFRAENDARLSLDDLNLQLETLDMVGASVSARSFMGLGEFLTTGRADQAPPAELLTAVTDWLQTNFPE